MSGTNEMTAIVAATLAATLPVLNDSIICSFLLVINPSANQTSLIILSSKSSFLVHLLYLF